jgi:two-component system, chemotaxis family, chemotaxis protein CheY
MRKDAINRTEPARAVEPGLTMEHIATLHQECRDRLEEAETDLISVADGTVKGPADLVNRVFRAFHSVKSAVGYLHLDSLISLSHLSESVLAEVRDGNIEFIPAHAEVLLAAADRIREALSRKDPSEVDLSAELKSLSAILNSERSSVFIPPPPVREEAKPSQSSRAGPAQVRRLKMLVAEDEFTSRVLLQGLLSHYGECHIAVTGKEAVEAFRAARQAGESYDLICMDIRMPEMDGPEAVKQIRQIESSEQCYSSAAARIFMTTGVHEMKVVMASFQALADAYLLKPIQGDDLINHLRSFDLLDEGGKPTPRS